MCLAVPAQIKELEATRAVVELQGNRREADVSLIENAVVGDWVLVHAGFAIERLAPEDAQETLKMFAELEGLQGAPPSD